MVPCLDSSSYPHQIRKRTYNMSGAPSPAARPRAANALTKVPVVEGECLRRLLVSGGRGMPSPDKALEGNGVATLAPTEVASGDEALPAELGLHIHRLMVRTRAMEERMIKMSKSGEGYFWIGGPGEEAFNACLGLQVKKGQGPHNDFLILHYRNSATLVAMGMPMLDGIRQMAMTVTDPHSRGRNFGSHFARHEWNVIPVTSVIEMRHTVAPGCAWCRNGSAATPSPSLPAATQGRPRGILPPA